MSTNRRTVVHCQTPVPHLQEQQQQQQQSSISVLGTYKKIVRKLKLETELNVKHGHLELANASRAQWPAMRRKILTYILYKLMSITHTGKDGTKKSCNAPHHICFFLDCL